MLAIKLKRIGKKGQASFRIIVTEKRSKVHGRFVEDLGWYNPHTDEFKIDKDKAGVRMKTGAQPTDSVYNLLVKAGVIKGAKKPVHKISKKSEEKSEEKPAEAATAIEAQAAPVAAESNT